MDCQLKLIAPRCNTQKLGLFNRKKVVKKLVRLKRNKLRSDLVLVIFPLCSYMR